MFALQYFGCQLTNLISILHFDPGRFDSGFSEVDIEFLSQILRQNSKAATCEFLLMSNSDRGFTYTVCEILLRTELELPFSPTVF